MQSLLPSNSLQRNFLETRMNVWLLRDEVTWRNTSGTFSVWCSSLPRLPFTSAKWGWLFRNTPFVSSRHSSRKESLTTAATGPGRTGSDGGTTNAVPSHRRSRPPVQGASTRGPGRPPRGAGRCPWLAQPPHEFIPSAWVWAWDALLADSDPHGQLLLFRCGWMWPFPHRASFSLHSGVHPLWKGGCGLTILGSSSQVNLELPKVGGLADLRSVTFIWFPLSPKYTLIFYIPSTWLAISQEKHFKLFHWIFSFPPCLSQNFCIRPKYWCLHRISYSAKGIFSPIVTGVFHAWHIGCRWHHLKLL